jgi:hypothetical protein
VKRIIAALVIGLVAPAAASAQERYDPERAGHPLRIIAYAAHPVGWLLDRLIFFPAWWIGGHEPLRSIVGHAGLPPERIEPRPLPEAEPVPAEPEDLEFDRPESPENPE